MFDELIRDNFQKQLLLADKQDDESWLIELFNEIMKRDDYQEMEANLEKEGHDEVSGRRQHYWTELLELDRYRILRKFPNLNNSKELKDMHDGHWSEQFLLSQVEKDPIELKRKQRELLAQQLKDLHDLVIIVLHTH
jgi:hypothetical protein